MTTVALVEDDSLVRAGLSDWLATIPAIQVLYVAGSAAEALCQFEKGPPDVALVDVLLPGVSGINLVRTVRERWPGVQSVMLTGAYEPDLVLDAFEAGARGYLPKLTSAEELSLALREVRGGRYYLSPTIAEAVLQKAQELRATLRAVAGEGSATPALEDRDRELLKLIAEGRTFAEIASRLKVSSRSVERMKVRLEEKLKAHSLADLIRYAMERGLVQR